MMANTSRGVIAGTSVAPNSLPPGCLSPPSPRWWAPVGWCCGIACLLAVLLTGPLGSTASALPVVSFQNITIDTGTIPGYVWGVSNTTPIFVTATFNVASGTGGIPLTWGLDANFAWSMSGTTWSGGVAPSSSLQTTGSITATTPGYLFQPISPLNATVVSNTATLTEDANVNIGDTQFGAQDVTLASNTSSTIATVQFQIAPNVRYGTYTFTFDDNPAVYGFASNNPPDFEPIPYTNGGGLITVVPEPATAGVLAGMAVAGAGYTALRWRRRRRDRGLLADGDESQPEGEAARGV
jgi:hypothetical protein